MGEGRRMQRTVETRQLAGGRGVTKVLLVTLLQDERVRTAGDNVDLILPLHVPELDLLGPSIYRMRVHWEAETATTNFTGKLTSVWSVSKKTWSSATTLVSQAGNGQVMGSWLSDTAEMGLNMRYALVVKNTAGSAIESAQLTVVLEIELKS